MREGKLVREKLLRMGKKEHLVVMVLHHIIADGWSLGVMMRELGELYERYRQGERSELKEVEIQYADYAIWQRKWLQGAILDRQIDYWKQQLAGMSGILEHPTDYPRPVMEKFDGGQESFAVSRKILQSLKALSREEAATLFMTLLAAFNALLHRYSGQQDFSVGTPIANRHRADLDSVIGFFVNTLVIRLALIHI